MCAGVRILCMLFPFYREKWLFHFDHEFSTRRNVLRGRKVIQMTHQAVLFGISSNLPKLNRPGHFINPTL
jgi:hypothetical protein